MSENNTGLSLLISDAELVKAKELDNKLVSYQNSGLTGVARSVAKVKLINELKVALSTTGMLKEVMELQGKKYGFLTDVAGYKADIVHDCLMEAMIFGVEPTGNQFNIIAGKMYVTKEGCTQKLINMGVQYDLLPALSKMLETKMCVVPITIKWVTPNGSKGEKYLEIPVSAYDKTSEAAKQGMADRDAKAWLIQYLTGNPIPIGDVADTVIVIKPKPQQEPQQQSNPVAQKTEEIAFEEVKDEVIPEAVAAEEKVDADQQRGIDYLNKAKDIKDLDKRLSQALEVDRGTGCIHRAYDKKKTEFGG